MPLGDLLTKAIQQNLGAVSLANPSVHDFDQDERLDCVQASFTAVVGYGVHFQCPGGTVATNMCIYSLSRVLCPLWELRMTPDKGRGLFALVDIPRGTHLLVEEPLVTIEPPPLVPGVGFSLAAMEFAVVDAFEGLTPIKKEEYLSCHEVRFVEEARDESEEGGPHSGRLLRILRSNAYNTQDGRVALYPKVALMNHDCRPNVLNTDIWDKTTADYRRIIIAARDIVVGEELVTTYIPLLADTATRRSRLAQYGFTCMCQSCAAESAQDDDERMYMRQVLDELEAAVDLPQDDKEQQRVFAFYAAKLATYIAKQGFVDYAAKTSKLAADFASRAGNTEAGAHWSAVHKAALDLAGKERIV